MKLPVEIEEALAAVGINTYPTSLVPALHWLSTERRRRVILEATYQRALADHGVDGAKPHAEALEDSDMAIAWLSQLCTDFVRAEVTEVAPPEKPRGLLRRLIVSVGGRST